MNSSEKSYSIDCSYKSIEKTAEDAIYKLVFEYINQNSQKSQTTKEFYARKYARFCSLKKKSTADGLVITESDRSEINEILASLFSDNQIIDGRVFLEKQSPNGKSVAFYTRNVYHLGGDWSSEKKRIEIGKDFLSFYKSNKEQNIETILLGVYHYYPDGNEGVLLFVCFSAASIVSF